MSGTTAASVKLRLEKALHNIAPAELIERALAAGEGRFASNGALNCSTGDRTGRSPTDKYLEDTPGIHDTI